MTPKEAASVLVLDLPTTAEEIAAAFRRQVVRHHPDVRTMTVDMGGQKSMDLLREARDVLVNHTSGVKPACHVCGGDGEVLGRGFKPVPCPKGCKKPKVTRAPAVRRK